jgi:dihydrofolate reductase
MADLIYVANVSLDGYTADVAGNFQWTAPGDEVFTFLTDVIRPIGTHLYGRLMYETMAVWELDPALAAESDLMADFADVWRGADKVVYSTTLSDVPTARTRLESRFDPAAVAALKAATTSDLAIGGPVLASQAFEADLVDECLLVIYPMLVGGGSPAFPSAATVDLELVEERRFPGGIVSLRYRVRH